MTTTTPKKDATDAVEQRPADEVTFTIDDVEVSVPKGTLVIRAAEEIGIAIPRFCDHPLLEPVGACRQCLVEVAMPDREGNLRPMPKPQASCCLEATPGMVVKTQHTSAVADKAQHGQIEFLLVNHPLDCPTCDKGGECPLQNQAMSNGYGTSRFRDVKRTFPKPLAISTEILLDRDRCILCQRCTRFAQEIAGDQFIDLQGRGGGAPRREVHGTHGQQIGTFDIGVLDFASGDGAEVSAARSSDVVSPRGEAGVVSGMHPGPVGAAELDTSGRPFSSYYSGNTVQICPVGALTSSAYRFRSRPFDLVSTPAVAEHDSNGAAIRVDHRRGVVMRRLADEDPAVNEEWISDKDRFAFPWQGMPDRLTVPMMRDTAPDGTRGELRAASWAEALEAAAEGLAAARANGGVGVLPGGRLTVEDSYAYAKFARLVLGTNDVDHRARPSSAEEETFLAHRVAGGRMSVTFTDLEQAPSTLMVAFEPEDEGGIVFLRLRKGVRAHGNRIFSVAPFASRGLERLDGTLVEAAPGTEAEVLDGIAAGAPGGLGAAGEALGPDSVILVGERLAGVPGGLSAVLRLADRTGARLAWIPRRVGERGGVEMGTLPSLLPGGRPVADSQARVDLAAAWDAERLPDEPGRSTDQILTAAADGTLGGLVVGGLDPDDLADPATARRALETVGFVVSLEVRTSAATALADVVLPVAPPVERAGTYLNWEGRLRPFPQALASTAMSDHRALDALADAMDVPLGLRTVAQVQAEIEQLGAWDGARVAAPDVAASEPPGLGESEALLATWHMLIDAGRCQDGEAFLAGTAHRPVARLSPSTAQRLALGDGDGLTVRTDAGQVTLPLVVTAMPDGVVWLPTNSVGSAVRATLRADHGSVVSISAAALPGGDAATESAAGPAGTEREGL